MVDPRSSFHDTPKCSLSGSGPLCPQFLLQSVARLPAGLGRWKWTIGSRCRWRRLSGKTTKKQGSWGCGHIDPGSSHPVSSYDQLILCARCHGGRRVGSVDPVISITASAGTSQGEPLQGNSVSKCAGLVAVVTATAVVKPEHFCCACLKEECTCTRPSVSARVYR